MGELSVFGEEWGTGGREVDDEVMDQTLSLLEPKVNKCVIQYVGNVIRLALCDGCSLGCNIDKCCM